jgi:hypothetical protein
MICNACSRTHFKQFAVRADGMEIEQCTYCGLGVVARLPESTEEYYDDNYYVDGGSSGYEDYSFMAEHGLGWTAALVKLLSSQGKILDIGCADGYLLNKFTASDFEKSALKSMPRPRSRRSKRAYAFSAMTCWTLSWCATTARRSMS